MAHGIDAIGSRSCFFSMALRARERWFIMRLGLPIEAQRVEVRDGTLKFGPKRTLFFKTSQDSDDFIENYIMSQKWEDGEVESMPTIVFDCTQVETWAWSKQYHIYFRPHPCTTAYFRRLYPATALGLELAASHRGADVTMGTESDLQQRDSDVIMGVFNPFPSARQRARGRQ